MTNSGHKFSKLSPQFGHPTMTQPGCQYDVQFKICLKKSDFLAAWDDLRVWACSLQYQMWSYPVW